MESNWKDRTFLIKNPFRREDGKIRAITRIELVTSPSPNSIQGSESFETPRAETRETPRSEVRNFSDIQDRIVGSLDEFEVGLNQARTIEGKLNYLIPHLLWNDNWFDLNQQASAKEYEEP